jgi:hypothetical protein
MTDQLVTCIGHDTHDQPLYLVEYENEDRQAACRIEIGTGGAIFLNHVDPDLLHTLRRSLGCVGLAAA